MTEKDRLLNFKKSLEQWITTHYTLTSIELPGEPPLDKADPLTEWVHFEYVGPTSFPAGRQDGVPWLDKHATVVATCCVKKPNTNSGRAYEICGAVNEALQRKDIPLKDFTAGQVTVGFLRLFEADGQNLGEISADGYTVEHMVTSIAMNWQESAG